MLEKLRGPVEPIANYVAKFFAWLHPNTISLIGFVIGFLPVSLFMMGEPRWAGVGLIIHLFDFLDGAVAKFTGKVSLFGEVLDASLDRIIDGLVIFSIAKGGFVSWNLAIVVLIGSYLVSYVRARTGEAAAKKVKLNVGFAQRGERVIMITLASLFFIDNISIPVLDIKANTLEIVFVILAIFAWQTVIVRFKTAYDKLNSLKNEQKS